MSRVELRKSSHLYLTENTKAQQMMSERTSRKYRSSRIYSKFWSIFIYKTSVDSIVTGKGQLYLSVRSYSVEINVSPVYGCNPTDHDIQVNFHQKPRHEFYRFHTNVHANTEEFIYIDFAPQGG